MSVASDYICVWIQEGIVYAGIKRIYDYDENTGYVVEKFGYYYQRKEYENEARLLALEISDKADLPMKQKWD
jgi:hypothetical protein